MLDKDIYTLGSAVPLLIEEDDESDEILVFHEEEATAEDYEYSLGKSDLPSGYSVTELEQFVTFVRSSKDASTGNFVTERKRLFWCIKNGCEEAQPGVWSGYWYFTYLYGEQEGRRAWVETMSKRMVKEGGGRAVKVDKDDFNSMLYLKEKGKRAFSRGQYKNALDCYRKAENLMGGDVSGMYLVPYQRAEMVVILSNQAECYLRMRKYEEAIVRATAALQLDKRHQKSLFRRARAIIYGAKRNFSLNSMVVARAAEDLHAIIAMKKVGANEAEKLMDEIDTLINGQ